jgi:uncharacterized membrane protein
LAGQVAEAFDIAAAGILAVGFLWSSVIAARTWRAEGGSAGFRRLRSTFGSVLLLGLEVFVAADLVRTVAVDPTPESVLVLGIIVIIRTFLSFSLHIEIEGTLPWRRGPRTDRPTSRG